ncbi:Cyclic pyranopterin monophosphate synthase accessory protein [Brachyspira suanatina]|uniref:Cyclic pyranopterin monophosphate synthase accessory protein n=1 Tax=Brachyspira suanatina TaxID=381802 RepID=A0A0G4K6E0_9SPIR|nr:cyclic pyranopterin monophosphate synthase MoaC [Brachyspira suanatina]CRF32950.1 Cyclic pyranopterin monophosphate synthase accessory protein [Brachyspira suanatina]
MNDKLTHIDESGNANMVDVGDKDIVKRTAEATGKIYLSKETLKLIEENNIKKGDVISVARIAGIMGAKHTSELIPLCHNINIEKVSLYFTLEEDGIVIKSYCRCSYKTGIEMEALTAVSVAALTIWDMCKAVDKNMRISDITLLSKTKS